jgi:hypothetical protein
MAMQKRKTNFAGILLIGVGSFFGLWSSAAVLGGLHKVGWNIIEFARSGLVASGMIQPIHTMVDFYTHIKGIEYIICVAFFVVFPLFYRFIDRPEKSPRVTVEAGKEQ